MECGGERAKGRDGATAHAHSRHLPDGGSALPHRANGEIPSSADLARANVSNSPEAAPLTGSPSADGKAPMECGGWTPLCFVANDKGKNDPAVECGGWLAPAKSSDAAGTTLCFAANDKGKNEPAMECGGELENGRKGETASSRNRRLPDGGPALPHRANGEIPSSADLARANVSNIPVDAPLTGSPSADGKAPVECGTQCRFEDGEPFDESIPAQGRDHLNKTKGLADPTSTYPLATPPARLFYHHDALGSIVNLTDDAGAMSQAYLYDAWGNYRELDLTDPASGNPPVYSSTPDLDENGLFAWEAYLEDVQQAFASDANRFTYTGHQFDPATGLYYFRARFYDPELGRFTSQDPYLGDTLTPPSLHRYLYAYTNPLVYVDLNGYATERSISVEDFKHIIQGHIPSIPINTPIGTIHYPKFRPEEIKLWEDFAYQIGGRKRIDAYLDELKDVGELTVLEADQPDDTRFTALEEFFSSRGAARKSIEFGGHLN